MAERKPLFFNDTDGFNEEMATTDTATFGGLSLGGDLTFTAGEVKGLPATPSTSDAAASKQYVDAVAAGLDPKESVRAATTAALTGYIAAGSGVGKTLTSPTNALSHNTIDGVSLAVGNRVLVKDQSVGANVDHGVYTVTQLADGASSPLILTRATDFDEDAEVTNGAHCFVGEGTTNAGAAFVVITSDPITVDTTAIQFSQYAGPGTFTGGDGIDITSNEISVDLATGTGPGLEFGSGGDAGKLLVKLESDGAIRFDPTNKGLEVELESSNPTLQVTGNALGVKFDSNKGLQTGTLGMEVKVDGSTMTFDGSGQLQATGAAEAQRIENNINVDESIAVADPVYWTSTGDRIGKALANTVSKSWAFGIAKTAQAVIGSPATVVSHGLAANILSAATPGSRWWLQNAGGIATTRPAGSGARLIMMGMARNATDLWVEIRDFARRA